MMFTLLSCGVFAIQILVSHGYSNGCDICAKVQDCQMLRGMVPVDLQKYVEEFPCIDQRNMYSNNNRGSNSNLNEVSVCCPNQKQNLRNQGQNYPTNQTPNNFRTYPPQNGISNTNNVRRPINNRPTQQTFPPSNINKGNQFNNQDMFGNNFGNQNGNNFNNNDNTFQQQQNSGNVKRPGFNTNGNDNSNTDYESSRRRTKPSRRRPYTNDPNNFFNRNPFFIGQNQYPFVNEGNSRAGNKFSKSGQCSALTSFPPDPKTGCCGKDPSDSDRIIDPQEQYPSAPRAVDPVQSEPTTSYWPNLFGNLFGFKEREKRSSDVTNITIDNRIIGGKITEIDQFPWTVLLRTTFNYGNKESSFSCGGSLISARYVLTAAHCVKEDGARVSDVEVTLAEYDKRTFPMDCLDTYEGRRCIENIVIHAEDVIAHPNYDDTKLQNDIALIRLRSKAPYTEFIRPICLPPIDIDAPQYSSIPLSVAGWGRNGNYNSNVKQSTVVNLVPQRECKENYAQLTRRHLCAAGYSGEDTCKGDSGGPLMILYEAKYFVSGIVSGKRADSPCGTSVPSLYTNVYQYLDWIRSNIRS